MRLQNTAICGPEFGETQRRERGHSHMTINWRSKVKIEAIQEHLTVKIASCCDSPNFERTTCKFSSSLV